MSAIGSSAVSGDQSNSSKITPDFTAIKKKQQATWSSGDYSVVASRIVYQAEQLCETADLQAGWRVLDVATGSGNAALAAARRGCQVVGTDYAPVLLERARIRAKAEHLEVEFREGDAEQLPFGDGEFDAVTSIYGAMFAPNHEKVAAELARVCKRGGRIALACWSPSGFIGETFKILFKIPSTAAGTESAACVGGGSVSAKAVREERGDDCELSADGRFPVQIAAGKR